MARHDLSAAGRLRCAESGARNLQRWRAGEVPEGALDFEREIEVIRTQLQERATLRAEPARGILIRSAVVQFMKIRLHERQLLRTARLSAKAPLGADDLAPLTGNLLRTLKALGIVDHASSDEPAEIDQETVDAMAKALETVNQ